MNPFRIHRLLADLGAVIAGVMVILAAVAMSAQPSAPDCTLLRVWSSTEPGKSSGGTADGDGLLQKAAAAFSKTHEVGGHCVDVDVRGLTSGSAELRLQEDPRAGSATGSFRPDVWMPTDSMWPNLLKQRTGQALTVLGSVAASPVVVAVTPTTADQIGWDRRNPSWSDLRTQIRSGHLQLLKENPNFSTSGAAATLLAYRAGVGSGLNGTGVAVTDVTDDDSAARNFAADIEQGVVTYPNDIIEILDDLASTRPGSFRGANALILQESLLNQYHAGRFGDVGLLDPRQRLQLLKIPISDGTMMLDHPYVVLPWAADQAQVTKVAKEFFDYLQQAAQQKLFKDEGFRSYQEVTDPDPEIQVFASPPRDGAVVDAVLTDWERLRKRTRVLVLLDVSKSMVARIEAAKDAARRGISRLGANDHVAVWGFPGRGSGPTDKFAPFAGPGPRPSAVDGVTIHSRGGSPLYVALSEAKESVLDSRPAGNNEEEILAIVVVTDGKDNPPGRAHRRTPSAQVTEIIDRLKDQTHGSVHVFPIAIGDKVNTTDLKNIADKTGGRAYCLDTTVSDANCQREKTDQDVFDQIFKQLGGGPHQPAAP